MQQTKHATYLVRYQMGNNGPWHSNTVHMTDEESHHPSCIKDKCADRVDISRSERVELYELMATEQKVKVTSPDNHDACIAKWCYVNDDNFSKDCPALTLNK